MIGPRTDSGGTVAPGTVPPVWYGTDPTTNQRLESALSEALENLFASKFIARTDVKAVQSVLRTGTVLYSPHTEYNPSTRKYDGPRIPWRREDLKAHIEGAASFGHYLLNQASECKLFAFDIDLEKTGTLPSLPLSTEDEEQWKASFFQEPNLRGRWLERGFVGRDYMKLQFKQMAHMLLKTIVEELELPCAAAYSGGKGVHVYGFTGLIPAEEAREGAKIVLDTIGMFKPLRGDNFFSHVDFENLSIELFPKQDSLDGKDLGNLMRLPLGRNLKAPGEPTFFIDMTSPLAVMQPMDAETALQIENPWVPF